MKNIIKSISTVILLLTFQFAIAQTAPATTDKPVKAEWIEKDAFHKVIAETFHPMEEGNLDPIRKRSEELHMKAMAWQASQSRAPQGLDATKVAMTLRTLTGQTKELDAKIKANAKDDVIKADLTKIHDTFHSLVGLCSPGDHHGHDHGSHDGHKH